MLKRREKGLLPIIGGVGVLAGLLAGRSGDLMKLQAAVSGQNAEVDHRTTNRLIHEKSPYLLMHAHNPVDWFPWGKDAFEKARRENKPIFLSVGYYTCHWCHVMEQESFSDPTIAEIMNRHFVSIKVDREERPDIDQVYMAFVESTTGGGGWPMSVFLTSDLKPFFGGTYFPKEGHGGQPGFPAVLLRVVEVWQKDRNKIVQSANQVAQELEKALNADVSSRMTMGTAVLDKTYQQIKATYDRTDGGFGAAPKFPRPVVFNFLLRYYSRTGQKDALEMTLATLRAMARGGIHDHLGGGFHRYSTDAFWRVPHFEKMLYDQAQLAVSYTEAYQITHDPFFTDTARDILSFILREMRAPGGGFYSAEDADSLIEKGKSQRAEGAFYVWDAREIERILGSHTAAIFDFYYAVESSGNIPPQRDARGEFKGKNILYQRHSLAETARRFGMPERDAQALLASARQKLSVARSQRPRPAMDDKIVTAWNGLTISALARASQAMDESQYLAAAVDGADFLRSKLYDPASGRLKRRYRAGDVAVDGFLSDYAFLIQGLLDLYEASFEIRWLSLAVQLQEKQEQLFWDSKNGGYFATTAADASMIMRVREDYDGAEPSGNSVAAMNLLRLAQITGRKAWRDRAEKTFAAFGRHLETRSEALPQMMAALEFSQSKPKQIIIAGDPSAPDTRALLRLVHERFLPNKILLLADGGRGQKRLARWIPFIQGMTRKQGRATAYICEDYVCKLPTADARVVARLLDGKSS